jgi:mannose-6-phosphate isomerase-like protein (cupin superfamily)
MKLLLTIAALLAIAALRTAAQSPAVTYVDHDKVAAALSNGGSLVTAANLTVSGARRTGPGQVEVHETETDVLYITDGEATFVTGGTMVGGRGTRPGQFLGTDIQGGVTQHLTKGDVIVIPAGTPHWWKEVTKPISLYAVSTTE